MEVDGQEAGDHVGLDDMRWSLAIFVLPVACGCAVVGPEPDPRTTQTDIAPCTRELSFAPARTYDAAAGSRGVVVTDLNGDGKPDLVVPVWHYGLNGGYDATRVFLNQGDGSFGSGIDHARDHDLVAVGDLNRDGRPDLVVAASSPAALVVLLNRGDGRFTAQPAMTIPAAPADPLQGAVGDVDGDGTPDLYWMAGGTLTAFHGNGDGTLAPTPVTTTFAGAERLQVADLDGDKVVDVVASGAGGSLEVFLNDGKGVFPVQGTRVSPATGTARWFFVDWNGDGRPDLFAGGGTTYTVLLNAGNGTFATQLVLSPPAMSRPPDYLTVADMNGDGHADLVWGIEGGSHDTVDVWLNDGHDAFPTRASASLTRYGVGIQAADLDGDRRLDLVAQSQPRTHSSVVSVLLSRMCPP